uniref:ADP-ribose pyrophosphatase n=1 Tax=Candidatus Kentrum sp. TUN TaxID=2126343 RepID=A0A451AV03_9GAMM|nr:MAG: ADP-ribose pyrophosphatase [Candidatus Kentron sp. TUN]VFK69865.1 MAG: ADP-ribose pyrophosphatase [Candidatus Kentron sp. TUN]
MEKIRKTETLFQGKKFEVRQLAIELESGETANWEIVHKGNSVAMVPVDRDNNVYLVEEYFAATDERALCLPKGMIDKGESPSEAALRELQEEIGMRGALRHLVDIRVSPGYLTQITSLFLVTDLEPAKREGDEQHYLEPVKMPLEEALNKVKKGEITKARTIGGLALAMLMSKER